jgi:hypothetical protein
MTDTPLVVKPARADVDCSTADTLDKLPSESRIVERDLELDAGSTIDMVMVMVDDMIETTIVASSASPAS